MVSVSEEFLKQIIASFTSMKENADKAMSQLHDKKLFHHSLNKADNSIYILVKHLTGNMRSRWTNIFTTDGEKKGRDRPTEFSADEERAKEEILRMWNQGWKHLFDTLNNLQKEDLLRTIYIRKEPHSVLQAILRQHSHYAMHIGQIIQHAKILLDDEFETLSIPTNKEIFDYRNL